MFKKKLREGEGRVLRTRGVLWVLTKRKIMGDVDILARGKRKMIMKGNEHVFTAFDQWLENEVVSHLYRSWFIRFLFLYLLLFFSFLFFS